MSSPTTLGAPPPRDAGLIAVAVTAVSFSGPLVVAIAAPALAIAFWRNAFGALAIAGYVGVRREGRAELRRLVGHEVRLSTAAGVLLSLHFATWITSLRLTSVASSVALVAMQPVWALLLARLRGHPVPGNAWVGIAVALSGVVLLTGVDAGHGTDALVGDLLALLGGVFAAGYVTVGAEVRRTVGAGTYSLLCYSTCAVILAGACLVGGVSLAGFDLGTWAGLVLLTVLAQLLGHTLINLVLRSTSPTVVSLALLLEVPGSILVAAVLVSQRPTLTLLPAVFLILIGIAVVVRSQGGEVPEPEPPG